jgi:hypothetical protein
MEVKVFVHQVLWEDGSGSSNIVGTHPFSADNPQYILAAEVTIEVPPFDRHKLVLGQIAALRRKQGELQAASNEIEGKIQNLQCLEYRPNSENVSELDGGAL